MRRSKGVSKGKGHVTDQSGLKGRMTEVYTKAAMLFKEKGYVNTSVNEIARELNIRKASLYYYIKDKETLLFDILNQTMDHMLGQMKEVHSLEVPSDEKLTLAIQSHIENAVHYLNEFSVLLHDTKQLQPELREIILSKRKEYEMAFIGIIRNGVSKKVFRREDEKMVAYMILGCTNWLYQWFSHKGKRTPKEIADLYAKIFLKGILERRQDNGLERREVSERRER